MLQRRGRSSVVERQLPKLYVVGSIPIARSNPPLAGQAEVTGKSPAQFIVGCRRTVSDLSEGG